MIVVAKSETLRPAIPAQRPPKPDTEVASDEPTPDAAPSVATRAGMPARRAEAALPLPPDCYETQLYHRRGLWALLVPSLISFSGLTASQVLFVQMSPWLWLIVPAFAFT